MKQIILILAMFTSCQAVKPHADALAAVRNYADSTDFEQTGHQLGGGVQVNFAGRDSAGLEVAYLQTGQTTYDDDYVNRSTDYTKHSTRELSVGLRKAWALGSVQPFISGGVALSMTKTEVGLDYDEPVSDHGMGWAPYAQVGINYLFNERWSAGLSYRRVFWGEDTDAFSVDPSSDSNTVLFAVGYSF